MTTESTGYRFQDTDEESGSLEQAAMYSVEFHPSLDDYAAVVQQRAKTNGSLTPVGKLSVQIFFVANAIGLPAVLLIYQHPLLAIASLALNLFLTLFFFPAVFRYDYRRYFQLVYGPNFENELIRVDLTRDGIHISHLDDTSFHSWKSVKGVDETDDSIFVHLRSSSIPIRKSGFQYKELETRFVEFARERYEDHKTSQLSQ